MTARAGNYVWKPEHAGARSLVCSLPVVRHPNRLAEMERRYEKAARSLQRKQRDDWRWAQATVSTLTLPAELRSLSKRCARRARVMYGRIAKMAFGGAR